MRTSDLEGNAGYGSGSTAVVNGTSFAAPAVAGVAALMLEANPLLGWRDVMEIMALSATKTDPGRATWQDNGATGANGGGFWTSRDYGFGLIDASAAVRLAESWDAQSTSANMLSASIASAPNLAVPDLGAVSVMLEMDEALSVEQIELRVAIDHTARGNLIVTLTSPSGTESVLIDRPAIAPGGSGRGDSRDDIRFTLTSNEFWGEDAAGAWTVRVQDAHGGDVGTLETLALTVHGAAADDDDTYVYTDAFAAAGKNPARRLIDDRTGVDTINAAALTSDVVIDLVSGMTIAGHAVAFAAGTAIEHAYGGDGDDSIAGTTAANRLTGARGDDTLTDGAGSDTIDGGAGEDTAVFAGLRALYEFVTEAAKVIVQRGEGAAREVDQLSDVEWFAFDDVTLSLSDLGADPPPDEPENTTPVARDDGPFDAVTGEETAVALATLLANDTDDDGDTLSVSEIVSVTGGSGVLAGSELLFTPEAAGNASLVYRVSDGAGGEDVATARFTVADPPPPPPPPPAEIDAASFSGLNLWFDASVQPLGNAARLTDLSGRGSDAVAAGTNAAAEATTEGLVFDGDDVYRIADKTGLNLGGPFDGKTLVFAIETGTDVTVRQLIYEQGGTTRGLSVYVEDGALVMAGWNRSEDRWGVLSVSEGVTAITRMSVALTFDAAAGTITGTRDGAVFGVATGADRLYNHSDDIALGGVRGNTLDADGARITSGGDRWTGTVFEVAAYDRALNPGETSALLSALGEKWQADDAPPPPPANTAPVARDDGPFAAQVGIETTVALSSLLANDTDSDGDTLFVENISSATGGVAQIEGDSLRFTADAAGDATVIYRVADGEGGTDDAAARFTVTAPPPEDEPTPPMTIPGPDDPSAVLVNNGILNLGDRAKTHIYAEAMEGFTGELRLLNKANDPKMRGIQEAAGNSTLTFADPTGRTALPEFETLYALALAGEGGLSVTALSDDTLRFEIVSKQEPDVAYFLGAFVEDLLS